MGMLEWGLIGFGVLVLFACLAIAGIVVLVKVARPKPRGKATATLVASPIQRASMFDALDAGAPGAQAKIEAAMVDYAVREKLKAFSAATAPLMADPAAPKSPPAS